MRAEGAADACSSGSESDEMEAGPAWGAATLPMHVPSPSTACAPAHGNTPLSQLQVPVGIGVAGSSATIPASITSTEHLAAYADYCKRALSNAVNGPLLSKRDALLHQLSRVQSRADEVRAVASEVERAVRTAAEEALEGLRAAELRRGALLQAQADELERALEALERTAEGCGAACAASEPPLAFLQRFRALSDTCERLTLKPLREDIEVSAEEFEQEARASVASQAERDKEVLQKLLTVKDEMIWALIEERDALRADLASEQGEEA